MPMYENSMTRHVFPACLTPGGGASSLFAGQGGIIPGIMAGVFISMAGGCGHGRSGRAGGVGGAVGLATRRQRDPGRAGAGAAAVRVLRAGVDRGLAGSGAATATTTSILAALWPDSHHILDWRVLAAVAGLGLVAGGESNLDLATAGGRDPVPPALDLYPRVRILLIRQSAGASVPLRTRERALYLMSRAVKGRGTTWAEYGGKLREAALADRASGADGTSDDEQDTPPAVR